MKRLFPLVLAVLGALLLSTSVATAKPEGKDNAEGANSARKLAKQDCKAQKRADKRAFKAVYGKRAMRTCVKGEKPETKAEIRNAAQECKAQRADDREAFRQEFGSGKKGRNAFGKCVSSKVGAEADSDEAAFRNAAKECKAERADDREAFRAEFGSEQSQGRNAFGKCVSSKASEKDEADGEAPTEG